MGGFGGPFQVQVCSWTSSGYLGGGPKQTYRFHPDSFCAGEVQYQEARQRLTRGKGITRRRSPALHISLHQHTTFQNALGQSEIDRGCRRILGIQPEVYKFAEGLSGVIQRSDRALRPRIRPGT